MAYLVSEPQYKVFNMQKDLEFLTESQVEILFDGNYEAARQWEREIDLPFEKYERRNFVFAMLMFFGPFIVWYTATKILPFKPLDGSSSSAIHVKADGS